METAQEPCLERKHQPLPAIDADGPDRFRAQCLEVVEPLLDTIAEREATCAAVGALYGYHLSAETFLEFKAWLLPAIRWMSAAWRDCGRKDPSGAGSP